MNSRLTSAVFLSSFFCVLLLPIASFAEETSWNFEGEAGHHYSLGLSKEEPILSRAYLDASLHPKWEITSDGSTTSELILKGRGIYNFLPEQDATAEVRALTSLWKWPKFSTALGFQEVSWGETFGVYILDLVNPRDYRDPFFLDLDWVRLPVFALNSQLLLGPFSAQVIFVPVPRNPIAPSPGSFYDPLKNSPFQLPRGELRPFHLSEAGENGEGGGRLGWYFDFGLDLRFYYYRHWNRNLAYVLTTTTSGTPTGLQALQYRVNSYALSLSQALDDWIIREDALIDDGRPIVSSDLRNFSLVNYFQGVLGVDRTMETWTLGAQYHLDSWSGGGTLPSSQLNWWSGQIQKTFMEEQWRLKLFSFIGIDNEDVWLQPSVEWRPVPSIELALRVDIVRNPSSRIRDGILSIYSDLSKAFTMASWKF